MRVCSSRRSATTFAALWLIALAAAQSPAAQTQAQNPFCNGGGYSGNFELGVVMQTTEFYTIVMHDMVTGQELAGSRRTINSATTPTNMGCHYYAYYDGVEPDFPNRVQFLPDRLYRVDMFPADPASSSVRASFYYHNGYSCLPGSDVFCPRGSAGSNPDLVFFIHPEWGVRSYPVGLAPFGVDNNSAEDIFGYTDETDPWGWPVPKPWVLPYDLPRLCALRPAECPSYPADHPLYDAGFMFLSRIPFASGPSTLPVTLTAAQGTEWRVPAGRSYTWSSSDVSAVRFGAGGKLIVRAAATVDGVTQPGGVLHASGITFTASDQEEGWLGMRYNDGSDGSLTAVTVEHVGQPGYNVVPWAGSAVTITDASPALTGVVIREPASPNSGGVRITGASAAPVITNLTATGLSGPAVQVTGDARADLYAGTISTNASGVTASGSGTVVYLAPGTQESVYRGADVLDNVGTGVTASSTAEVRFAAPSPVHGLVTVAGNDGRGLTASSGGTLYAGTATVYQRNRIFGNGTGTNGNVRANGTGSTAYVNCNWWGPTLTDFRAGATGGGTLALGGYLTADPRTNPNPPCVPVGSSTERTAGGTFLSGASSVLREGDATLTDRLLAALDAPTPAEAVSALAALTADEPESEEAAAALSEIGRFAAQPDAPASALAVLDATTAHARRRLRVAAWQSLVAVRTAVGDAAGAFAATDALMTDDAVVPAEAARVYLHAAAGDTTAAVAALERLETAAPESIEAAVARAYLGMGPDPFADDARRAGATYALAGETTRAAGLTVAPNPASETATLTLVLDAASEVHVTMHDLLGRMVTMVASGVLEAGTHRAEVLVSGLAPGVYVVRVVVSGTVQTTRLTVAR